MSRTEGSDIPLSAITGWVTQSDVSPYPEHVM
jgi:hypothetical protein